MGRYMYTVGGSLGYNDTRFFFLFFGDTTDLFLKNAYCII